MASRAGSDEPCGSSRVMAGPSPWSVRARTIRPSPSTNSRNGTAAARTIPAAVVSCRARPRAASSTAPPSAAQAGLTPANEVTMNPASVASTTNRG